MEVAQTDQYERDTLVKIIIEKEDSSKRVKKSRKRTQTKFWNEDTTFYTGSKAKVLIKRE